MGPFFEWEVDRKLLSSSMFGLKLAFKFMYVYFFINNRGQKSRRKT